MTFWDFLEKHRQLVSGRIIVAVSIVDGLNAAGAFHGLLGGDKPERWFGITIALSLGLIGGAVSGRAKESSGQQKVADAVTQALNATPGEPLPKAVTDLTQTKPPPSTADLIVQDITGEKP